MKMLKLTIVTLVLAAALWSCSDSSGSGSSGSDGNPPEGNLRDYSIQMFFGYFSHDQYGGLRPLSFDISFFVNVGYEMPTLTSCTIARKLTNGQIAHSFTISPSNFTVQSINGEVWNAYNSIYAAFDETSSILTIHNDTYTLDSSTCTTETDSQSVTYIVPYSFTCTASDGYEYTDIQPRTLALAVLDI